MRFLNKNLVSIITPSYKSEKYISQAIESVLAQTYQNWEMIIVDDASPDNANTIIKHYIKKDNRIKIIELKVNSGPAQARNRAIEEAKGEYMAFLDSDDIWLPKKLEKQIIFMKENKLNICCSSYYVIDENGKRKKTRKVKTNITYSNMLKSNHIGNLTGIYNVNVLGKIYMDNVGHEDYALWLKVMKKAKVTIGMKEPLAEYRVLTKSLSANKFKSAGWTWNIYRNILHFSVLKSLYYYMFYIFYSIYKRS